MRRAATALMPTLGMACALLAGCGQKGPLYLPEKTGTVVTRERGQAPPPAPAQAPAEEGDSKKEEQKPK